MDHHYHGDRTASLLELIDTTIVNVALPHIQGNLGATLEDVAWVVTGYAVANVIILPMSGWLGGRFGRKNYFPGIYRRIYHCIVFMW
jgi:DHA2 family multidrug resistance protein